MKVIWSDTLDAIGSYPALKIEVVLREPKQSTIMTVINCQALEFPNGPCLVRTISPVGQTGPIHFRNDTLSALAKARLLADALRLKRRMPSNG